jgi:hypothetical protein
MTTLRYVTWRESKPLWFTHIVDLMTTAAVRSACAGGGDEDVGNTVDETTLTM